MTFIQAAEARSDIHGQTQGDPEPSHHHQAWKFHRTPVVIGQGYAERGTKRTAQHGQWMFTAGRNQTRLGANEIIPGIHG